MQRLAIAVIVGVIFFGGYYAVTKTNKIEYVQNEPVVVEKEVEVDALEEAIKTAKNAKSDATEEIAKKAYEDAKLQEEKKIELEVIRSFGEKLDARQTELEKETKQY